MPGHKGCSWTTCWEASDANDGWEIVWAPGPPITEAFKKVANNQVHGAVDLGFYEDTSLEECLGYCVASDECQIVVWRTKALGWGAASRQEKSKCSLKAASSHLTPDADWDAYIKKLPDDAQQPTTPARLAPLSPQQQRSELPSPPTAVVPNAMASCGLGSMIDAKDRFGKWCFQLKASNGKKCEQFYTIHPAGRRFTLCETSSKTTTGGAMCSAGPSFKCHVPDKGAFWTIPETAEIPLDMKDEEWKPWMGWKDAIPYLVPPGFKVGDLENGQPSDYAVGVCPDGCNQPGTNPMGTNPLGTNPGGDHPELTPALKELEAKRPANNGAGLVRTWTNDAR